MFLKKTGMPEEGDLLLCTVSKIYYNSVFVNLDEYPGKSGLIHISEIAPGRIRNIRDYVIEGKKIVCKVLRIDKEKGHIDLSLRRVGESQRREKVDELKQEQKAEKIIEHLSNEIKQDTQTLYETLSSKICSVYPTLFSCFQAVALGETSLEKLGIDKAIAKPLTELITLRIKPPKVEITGIFSIKSYEPEGLALIKHALEKGLKKTKTVMKYLGAGRYYLTVTAADYKEAEILLREIVDAITKDLNKSAEVKFERK